MLGVDGYTVKWGADTSDFDRANRHVVNESRRGAQEFESHWTRAAKSASDKFIGFRNAGDVVKVGVAAAAGAVGLLTKSFNELAKQNEETGRSIEGIGRAWSDVQSRLAVTLGGAEGGDIVSKFLKEYKGFVDLNIDFFEGAGTAAFVDGVMRDRAAQDALFKSRQPALERMSTAKTGLVRADLEMRARDDMQARAELFEAHREDALRKFEKEERTGDSMRIKAAQEVLALELQSAQTRFDADVQALNDAAAIEEKGIEEDRRRQAADRETNLKRFQDEEDRREQAVAGARAFLEVTRKTADIERLRAYGRTEEANAAQIRLDAEQDILAIMEREDAALWDRLDAAEAVLAARDAKLNGLVRPEARSDISTFLGPGGGGARGELAAQVLGGQNANYNRTISIAERQANLLEDIARNTAQPSLGVLGP